MTCRRSRWLCSFDNTNYAREKLLAAQSKRIADQIQPDGKMPRELARTLSFNYSVFNLRAEIGTLASLGDPRRRGSVALSNRRWPQPSPGVGIHGRPRPIPQINGPINKSMRRTGTIWAKLLFRAVPQYPGSPLKNSLQFYPANDFGNSPLRLYLKMASRD